MMDNRENKKPVKLSTLLGSILFLAILLTVTFYVIFKDNSLEDIMGAVRETNPFWLAAGIVFMYLSIACQAWAMYVPFRRLGCRVPFIKCLGYAFTGTYFSAITPSSTGGQPMQIYYMCRDGINLSYVTLTMLLTNVAYQFTVIFYGLVMFFLRLDFVMQNISGFWGLVVYGLVVNTVIIVVLMFLLTSSSFAERTSKGLINFAAKLRLVKDRDALTLKVERQISEYRSGAAAIRRNPRLITSTVGITVLQMTALYLIPFAVYKGFGLEGYSALDVVAIQAILYIAVSFVPLPGAVGVTETGFVRLFALIFGELVVPSMLVSRAINFYSVLFVSGFVSLFIYFRHKRISPDPSRSEQSDAQGED